MGQTTVNLQRGRSDIGHRTTARRAAAVRAAREAKAARDAERRRREKEIEAALADFYEAQGRAGEIRARARRHADRLVAEAEDRACGADEDCRRAVRALRGLRQSNAEIADLCGLTVPQVRAMANERNDVAGEERSRDRPNRDGDGEPANAQDIDEREGGDGVPGGDRRDRSTGETAVTADAASALYLDQA